MKREELLLELKNAVGNKNPIEFFQKFVDVFVLLFDKIENVEKQLNQIKTYSALAIKWEPKIASDLLAIEIEKLRSEKDLFYNELSAFKAAYAENKVTQNYYDFCKFWLDTLGYHPFINYR